MPKGNCLCQLVCFCIKAACKIKLCHCPPSVGSGPPDPSFLSSFFSSSPTVPTQVLFSRVALDVAAFTACWTQHEASEMCEVFSGTEDTFRRGVVWVTLAISQPSLHKEAILRREVLCVQGL
uniref:Uncharacterized protein n=1 Tax=Rousettus aegyptiacus TaxID=9407 RepID=A0A7J8DI74_ROUAE|nr:hypothetical protein HJG63_008566 [Rousettus aegyptiacus]